MSASSPADSCEDLHRRGTRCSAPARLGMTAAVLLALAGCTPQAQLLASLIPDGTAHVVLKNLEKVPDDNRQQVATLEAQAKWDELARLADTHVAKDPFNADWWVVAGYARTRQGDHAAAARAYGEAVRLEPQSMMGWNLLAQSHRAAGDPRRAVNTLQNALNIRHEAPETLYLLGESYSDLRRLDDAAKAYRQAVTLAPDFALAWYGLTRTYRALGRTDDALAARARLEKLDPQLAAQFR